MKSRPKAGKAKKSLAKTAQLSLPASTELETFKSLQKTFSNSLFLFHQNRDHRLFINLDTAKSETGFGAMIYHVKGKLEYLQDKKMVPLP